MTTILVGYDGTPEAADALALGRRLAAAEGGSVVAAYVSHFDPVVARADAADWTAVLARDADELMAELPPGDPPVTAEVVPARSTTRGLEALAEQIAADYVVVGSSRRGAIGRVLLGSVGEALLRGAPCAVAVAPRGFAALDDPALRVVGVGYDGSPDARLALERAEALALATGAAVRVVSSFEAPRAGAAPGFAYDGAALAAAEREWRAAIEADVERLDPAVRAESLARHGAAVSVLADEVERGIDLLFVGSRGHGPLRRAIAGSVAAKLARLAPCPVVVVPRAAVAARRADVVA